MKLGLPGRLGAGFVCGTIAFVRDLGKEYGKWESDRGSVATWVLPPNILVTVGEGHIDVAIAERIAQSGNVVIARYGSLVAFHDWQKVSGYDTKARVRLTHWGSDIRADVQRVHILIQSKLVKMGVTVASLVLGNMIVAYDDRAPFEAAFQRARSGGTSK